MSAAPPGHSLPCDSIAFERLKDQHISYLNTTNDSSLLDQACEWELLQNAKEASICSLDYWECRAQKYMWLVVPPILLLLGTVGNCLSFKVMMRPSLRKTSTACYIAALAVADTIGIWTGLTRHFVRALTYDSGNVLDVREIHPAVCKTQRFILYVALDTSVWLLVAVTTERFLAVSNNKLHNKFKDVSHALKVIAAIVVAFFLFNLHVFWTRGLEMVEGDENGTNINTINCGYPHEMYREYWSLYHGYVSMAVYCLIPFFIMLFMNLQILKLMRNMKRRFASVRTVSTQSTKSNMSGSFVETRATSITVMLLTVSFYFLLVGTPAFVYTIIETKLFFHNTVEPRVKAQLKFVHGLVTTAYYCNHALNFFLYCLTGRRFRRELKRMFQSCTCLGGAIPKVRKWSSRYKPKGTPDKQRDVASPGEGRKALPSGVPLQSPLGEEKGVLLVPGADKPNMNYAENESGDLKF